MLIQSVLSAFLSLFLTYIGSFMISPFYLPAGIEESLVRIYESRDKDDEIAKVAQEMTERSGMLGRWSIPALGIDVATFNSAAQEVVDSWDSAAMFPQGDMLTVGDHNMQSFRTLRFVEIGDKAYFNNGKEIIEYVCTKSFDGHNAVTDLVDENYESVVYSNSGGITCYTCKWSWENIRIVFFQPVSK